MGNKLKPSFNFAKYIMTYFARASGGKISCNLVYGFITEVCKFLQRNDDTE